MRQQIATFSQVNSVVKMMICTLLLCGSTWGICEALPVTSRDCVSVKYVTGGDLRGPITLNSQGTRVLYEVKIPELVDNRNMFDVYVKEIGLGMSRDNGTLVASGENVVGLRWLKDGINFLVLARDGPNVAVVKVNAITKARSVLIRAESSILDYSIDRDESIIVYSTVAKDGSQQEPAKHKTSATTFSRRVTLDTDFGDVAGVIRALYITRLGNDGMWSKAERVSIEDPFSHEVLHSLYGLNHLSLSPDGKRLLFEYRAAQVPKNWATHPFINYVITKGADNSLAITVLYDIQSGKISVQLNTIFVGTIPFWANDSRSFIVAAPAPIDTIWEKRDIQKHRTMGLDADLFWVDAISGRIEEVMEMVPSHHQPPLAWTADGGLVVKTYAGTISIFRHTGERWIKASVVSIPFARPYPFSSIASDGKTVVGVYESTTTPPDLFSMDIKSGEARLITKLNPQLDNVTLANAEAVKWTTSDGLAVRGLLFKPLDYVPGKRYPLVIQTKGQQDQSSFVCDSGVNHDPAFAPQPIAAAGMMYLIRTFPEDVNQADEIAKIPNGYPGNIGETVQQMNIWESAVRYLSDQGLVDPDKVGIIGFSRTGWDVEYLLTHGTTHFAAASVADNVEYSLGEYWLLTAGSTEFDKMYGGSPYGPALSNWIKYSISFNLDKMHTPLLMELMGHGVSNDVAGQIPPGLAARYETFVGLKKLQNPVELYYFPNQGHQPDAPQARIESLQQNVDWFSFWLQGYERPNPEDPDQYKRWEKMRDVWQARQSHHDVEQGAPNSAK
jgi:dipeptidyl aminopeptidase/acylaminoacyl peptidase